MTRGISITIETLDDPNITRKKCGEEEVRGNSSIIYVHVFILCILRNLKVERIVADIFQNHFLK